jgi:hypothetical protein
MRNASATISPKEFVDTYSRVNERTSSSFSGRHVGHYKAVLENQFLVGIHSSMMSIPYQAGFSWPRWHHVVDVMLEKDPGNPKQHRLSVIALVESDYNQLQRILVARPMNHHLEDKGIMLPDIQYGSRSERQCISPVLNKVLTYDLVRQTKVSGAFIENDAMGCFDRLVNTLVFLELRHLCVPLTVVQSMRMSWESASHHIKNAYGCLDTTYSISKEVPLFGPRQGSTTGPDLWGIMFRLIAKNMHVDRKMITF